MPRLLESLLKTRDNPEVTVGARGAVLVAQFFGDFERFLVPSFRGVEITSLLGDLKR